MTIKRYDAKDLALKVRPLACLPSFGADWLKCSNG